MAQLWEVVGGAPSGGILVREGQDLKSKELTRLCTGAIIEQVELVGERLSFKRVSGLGPAKGWVSLKVKGADIVVKTEKKEVSIQPVCMLFYSGGMTAPQGRNQMKFFQNIAKREGLNDYCF